MLVKHQTKYIESLILGFPVPQIVLAEMKKGKFIVLDGKQRLLTIMQFFGIANAKNSNRNNFKLTECPILKELDRLSYSELKNNPDYDDFNTQLLNQTVRCVIIKNWCNNETILEQIFVRLNTGSVPLSPHELRLALLPGPFSKFADEISYNCSQIHKLLGIENFDYRMRDAEFITRFFAFKFNINEYNGSLRVFLNSSVKKYNKEWETKEQEFKDAYNLFLKSLDFLFNVFEVENTFRKYANGKFEKRFNRAIMDGFVYFLSDEEVLKACIGKEREIKQGFISLCQNDADYLNSVGVSTTKMNAVKIRFSKTCNLLEKVIEIEIERPEILKNI